MESMESATDKDFWQNADDTRPAPNWVVGAAVILRGGRFALETPEGTVIVEMGDWFVRMPDGKVGCVRRKIL
jgi:hypothetical protein